MAPIITLTVEQDGDDNRDINALDIGAARREAVIDQSEAQEFMADCQGWDEVAARYQDGTTLTNRDRFLMGYGVVLTITDKDWSSWLEGFEVIEP
ncbi:MAG: hypothetical protein WA885_11400 [Phormidesmis sp.]